jgi:hypothetical protein
LEFLVLFLVFLDQNYIKVEKITHSLALVRILSNKSRIFDDFVVLNPNSI